MRRIRTPEPEAPPLSPLESVPVPLTIGWRVAAAVLVLGYIVLGAGHIYSTPVSPSPEFNYINAPDEAAHIMYVRAIAEGGRLPSRGDREFPTYEWHQPPLYYALLSLAYRAGPIAMRWATLALGTVALLAIFAGARLAFPDDPPLAVLALGFAAMLPMRQATTSAVGNDVLIELAFTAAIVCIVGALRKGFTIRRAAMLGVMLAMALLTKATGLLLIGTVVAAIIVMWRSGEDRPSLAKGALTTFGVALVLTGSWFARNMHLYHELTPAKTFLHEFEGTMNASAIMAKGTSRAEYLKDVGEMTFQSFWAAYTPHAKAVREGTGVDPESVRQREFFARNGIPLFMPIQFYIPYSILCAVALAGLGRMVMPRNRPLDTAETGSMTVSLVTFVIVLGGFVGFIWTFFQTQGRYLYPALFPISLFISAGFRAATGPRYRDMATTLLLALFALLASAFLFGAVQPAYQ